MTPHSLEHEMAQLVAHSVKEAKRRAAQKKHGSPILKRMSRDLARSSLIDDQFGKVGLAVDAEGLIGVQMYLWRLDIDTVLGLVDKANDILREHEHPGVVEAQKDPAVAAKAVLGKSERSCSSSSLEQPDEDLPQSMPRQIRGGQENEEIESSMESISDACARFANSQDPNAFHTTSL